MSEIAVDRRPRRTYLAGALCMTFGFALNLQLPEHL